LERADGVIPTTGSRGDRSLTGGFGTLVWQNISKINIVGELLVQFAIFESLARGHPNSLKGIFNECLQEFMGFYAFQVSLLMPLNVVF